MVNNFITFEGPDKSGKSTQCRLASEYLSSMGVDIIQTREPGGEILSERIRDLLLDPSNEVEDLTELLLYEAARSNLVRKIIKPSLANGKVVLCDRYADSTLAYQVYGRGLSLGLVTHLNDLATEGVYPGLTLLYLDSFSPGDATRLENAGEEFRRRVERGYVLLANKEPERIKIVRTIHCSSDEESIRRTFEEETLPFMKSFLAVHGYNKV